MKKIIPFCFLLLFTGCKKASENSTKTSAPTTSAPDTADNIDFINYPVDDLEGITGTGTEGVYRNFDFNYRNGETMFVLVPKIGPEKWYRQQVSQYKDEDADTMIGKKLSRRSFKDLCKEFNLFIFHTPKKYLKHTPNMDSPYTPQTPRTEFLYEYNSINNSWKTIDSFTLKSGDDEANANAWREKAMSRISSSDHHTDITQWIESKSTSANLDFNKECDLNQDHIKDRILVFTPKDINDQPLFSSVYVLMGKKDGGFTEYGNHKIINAHNSTSNAEGFRDIAIKNSYFTVEENIASQPVQIKYTTFVFNKKNNAIYLHKLEAASLFPDAAQDNEFAYSTKDFGKITFEEYDPMTVHNQQR